MSKIVPHNNKPLQPSLFDLLPPLPIQVANKWQFSLQHYETDNGVLYAIQDWIAGLTTSNTTKASEAWRQMKVETRISITTLDYLATDGKIYQREFTTDKGLYLIAQNLRSTKQRTALEAIKRFLAEAGAFVDELRRNADELPKTKKQRQLEREKELIEKAWSSNHEAIERKQLQIDVIKSWQSLQSTIKDMVDKPNYGQLTNAEYLNLFGATAKELKIKLNSKDIRADLATMALSTLRHAETTLNAILRLSSGNLTMQQTTAIYEHVLKPIGDTHEHICQQFGVDSVTGKPLLQSNNPV